MALPSAPVRRRLRLILGCLLFAAGLLGADWARRASSAQRTYHRAKHGFFRDTAKEVLPFVDYRAPWEVSAEGFANLSAAARAAAARYSSNYYFPAFTARAALTRVDEAETDEARKEALQAALYFSREAVALNPYDAEARAARADALAASGKVDEALEFWRPILEREFWNGANHDQYAWLLLLEGSRSNQVLAVREAPLVESADLRKELQQLGKTLNASN